jgi:release factor glutamine methyltransferase
MVLYEVLRDARRRLAAADVPSPDFDARALAAHVLRIPLNRLPLYERRGLSANERSAFEALVEARARRDPLQYITGVTGFYGREFRCDRRALIPRPDTETVVELALELARELGITRIVDLGTGTGIIALTLAAELPEALVLATDRSEEALALAAENVGLHRLGGRVRLARGRWLEAVHEGGWAEEVEMVVSNPPYVRPDAWNELMPEIREHEPHEALVGPDADGLGAYREIVAGCRDLPRLRTVVFEVGDDQAGAVVKLLRTVLCLRRVIVRADLGGIERAVAGVL